MLPGVKGCGFRQHQSRGVDMACAGTCRYREPPGGRLCVARIARLRLPGAGDRDGGAHPRQPMSRDALRGRTAPWRDGPFRARSDARC